MRVGAAGFRPPIQTPQPTPFVSAPVSVSNGQLGVETEAEAEARVEATLARMNRIIAERAGRVPPKGAKS